MTKGLERWRLRCRGINHVKTAALYLYPELECSGCVDDLYEASGEEQLRYYCQYLQRHYSHWWDADAVPIYWFVMSEGDDDGFDCEQAPWHTDYDNILRHYYPPTSVSTGERINWYKLPVANRRFPEFAKALGWMPAPGQLFAPLRSIVAGTPQEVSVVKAAV